MLGIYRIFVNGTLDEVPDRDTFQGQCVSMVRML